MLCMTLGLLNIFYVPLLALKQIKLIQIDLTWIIFNQQLKQFFDVFDPNDLIFSS